MASVYRIKKQSNSDENEKTKSFSLSDIKKQEDAAPDGTKPEASAAEKNKDASFLSSLLSDSESTVEISLNNLSPEQEAETAEQPSSGSSAPDLSAYIGTDEKAKEKSGKLGDKLEKIYGTRLNIPAVKQNLVSDEALDLQKVFSEEKACALSDDDTKEIPTPGKSSPSKDPKEETVRPEGLLADDLYSTDGDEEDEEEEEKPAKAKMNEAIEYTSPLQAEELIERYKDKSVKQLIAALGTLVMTFLLFYLESAGYTDIPRPSFLTPGSFGILYLLIDLQLLFISSLFILDNLYRGMKSLFTWRPTANSVTFVVIGVCALQVILHLIFNSADPDIMLFSSYASFCAFLNSIANFIELKREYNAFKVVVSKKDKLVASGLTEASEEYRMFSEYLPENPDLFSIGKTKFLKGYFERTAQPSSFEMVYKISIPPVLFLSAAFAVMNVMINHNTALGRVFDNFTMMVMMALPLSSVLLISLPFFKISKTLLSRECAIIGASSIDTYASASVISIPDTEVFPEKAIKVTSVKNYGSGRLDSAILYVAKVFDKAGGPLKAVFNRSIIGLDEEEDKKPVTLLETTADGICAKIDGKEVFVGNKNYMLLYDFGFFKDEIDDTFEQDVGKIMYLAVNDEIIAKFYIKYALGKRFKALLESLRRVGICIGIRTNDPNLDTAFVMNLLKNKEYPIAVIKSEKVLNYTPSEEASSGILSTSTVTNLLSGFIACDKLRQIINLNILSKYIGLLLGILIVGITYFVGGSNSGITPFFVLLYQFLWSLPVIGISLFQ